MLAFRVYGIAQQAGSKRAFVPKGWSRPIITDTNKNLKSWQQLVADAANRAILELPAAERGLLLEGVRLGLAFYLPRPKSLPRRVTANTKQPDLDKLVRAAADSLAGVVFRDDAQVVDLVAQKRYTTTIPYVDVRVEPSHGWATTLPLFKEVSIDGEAQPEAKVLSCACEGEETAARFTRHGRPQHRRARAGGARLRRDS